MFNYIKFWNFVCLSYSESWAWSAEKTPKKTEQVNVVPKLPDDKKASVFEWAKAERDELSVEKLSTITNKEFLKVWFERRLQYITSPKVDFEKVASWEQKEINFTFTFNEKFNKQFWLKTTAWQVMPYNVKILETADWHVWKRNWMAWEFFDEKGNRLIIWEKTKVLVKESISKEEIQAQETSYKEQASSYEKVWLQDLAYESLKRWLEPNIAVLLFGEKLKDLTWTDRKIEIEDLLTEFERVRDYYHDDYFKNSQEWFGLKKEFLAYFLNFKWYSKEDKEKIFESMWFDKALLEQFKRKEVKWYTWETMSDDEKREILSKINQVPEEFTTESFWTQFVPWSKKAKELFMYATNVAWFPEEWAQSESLHQLLKKESWWKVWVMNYEFKKSSAWDIYSFKDYVLENTWLSSWKISKQLWTVSNATWLGQMLIWNVDKYYPEWRKGIWKPLNEAVWMLKYIEDRYWSVEIANEMHWKVWYYNHPKKWQMEKKFKEWY